MNLDDHLLDFPKEVQDAAKEFRQGDVIKNPPLAYHTVGKYPLWALSKNADADGSIGLVELDGPGFDYAVITTQTCDIVEEESRVPHKPWIQVSPVYELVDVDEKRVKSIEIFANPDLVRLNGPTFTDKVFVADLRLSLPLEKSLLVKRDPIHGFATEEDVIRFADHCAAYSNRPALPGLVHDYVIKHLKRYFENKAERREACRALNLHSVRIKVSGPDESPTVQLLVILLNDEENNKKAAEAVFTPWWNNATNNIRDKNVTVTLLGTRYATLASLTAQEYLSSSPFRVDLVIA